MSGHLSKFFYCECCDEELETPDDVGYCDACSDEDCKCQEFYDWGCTVCGGDC